MIASTCELVADSSLRGWKMKEAIARSLSLLTLECSSHRLETNRQGFMVGRDDWAVVRLNSCGQRLLTGESQSNMNWSAVGRRSERSRRIVSVSKSEYNWVVLPENNWSLLSEVHVEPHQHFTSIFFGWTMAVMCLNYCVQGAVDVFCPCERRWAEGEAKNQISKFDHSASVKIIPSRSRSQW